MNNNVDPAILAEMDYEQQFMQSQQKGNRRVKMERGKMWLIRFVPAKLGPKGTWFARIARHWLSMKPIVCPRQTSPDFGGDPDADCPCCEVAANLNDSPDPEIAKFGFQSQGNAQWLTFCVAFEKDGAQQSMREVLMPYEFSHYRTTFEELMAFYKAGLRRSPNSVLDYKLGNDFVVTKTGKGFKLDKQDSAPIFDLNDANYKAYIEKIEAGIKQPKIQMPTNDQLYAFSLKIQEWSEKLGTGDGAADGGRGRRRTSAPADTMEDGGDGAGYQEQDDPAPAARPRAAAPASARRAPAPVDESMEPPAEDESNSDLMPEKKPAPAPAARRPAPAPVEAPVPTESEAPAPVTRRAPAPATPAAKLAPSPNRSRVASEATSALPEEPGEEEDLPEEATDPAPPTEAALGEAEQAAEPPPVTRRGGTGLGSSIRNKIDSMNRRGA